MKHADPRKYWCIINDNKQNAETKASLEDFYDFFKAINAINEEENIIINSETNLSANNDDINMPITDQEISEAVRRLKNNKAPGYDEIVNEQIKHSINMMLPIYNKLFNLVFNTGIVPEAWTIGMIKPIYKNKGDPKQPENYRPISLLSCLGKLFTSIINYRLNTYAETSNLIKETQAGFRNNFSTADNMFILKNLIDLAQSNKKKLFCCFVDFKQAFDSVWRTGLWQKLIKENINGKCLNIIKNLYSNIKSQVVTSHGSTEFFKCSTGVRQGENLSPFLFSIFLNDLDEYLQNHVKGVTIDTLADRSQIYLKLFILLYADDTVLFSDNEKDLQQALDKFESYCETWKLQVNVNKTKVLVFGKGRKSNKVVFKLGNYELEQVDEYKYLGLLFSRSGTFYKAKQQIAEQARKAMFSLLRSIRRLSLPIDIQIELFEKTIKPILLYGSEIWGFGNFDTLEKVQLQFYKYVFNLKKSTPSYMIYGETGVMPIALSIKHRVISYWARIIKNINQDESIKLSSKIYNIIYELHSKKLIKSQWMENVKDYICNSGYSGIWYSQCFNNINWFTKSSYQRIKDIYIQNWMANVHQTSNTNLYKYMKLNFERSFYLDKLPTCMSKILIRFLTRNHRLPIEKGRWQNVQFSERKCTVCNEVGDEYHYIFLCPTFEEIRLRYIDNNLISRPSMQKFIALLNCKSIMKLKKLSILCGKIMQHFDK